MASTQTPVATVKIVGRTIGTDLARCILNASNTSIANFFRNLSTFFQAIALGAKGFNGYVSTGGVQATDAVTFSSFVNTNTVTVNGVVFTGTSGSITTNAQFKIGATDTITASNFAARINNTDGNANGAPPAKVVGVVQATSAAAVATLTAVESGAIANLYTLAISANGSVTGANFAGGTDGTVTYISKGL